MPPGVGRETQLPSLELSIEGGDTVYGVATCDGGFSCAYLNNSWANRTTPMPRETNPRLVFERLFGDVGNTSADARRANVKRQKSILDRVMDKAADLKVGLAPYDVQKLDEYLEAVRGIERRIQLAEQQADRQLPEVSSPAGIPVSYEEHVRLMFDLMVLAYQTDMTRVISLMMAREESGATYPQIGVTEPHHPLSHHRDIPEKIEKLGKINAYHMKLFSEFLVKMRETPDGDGSLLDHAMVMYGGALRNSNAAHDREPADPGRRRRLRRDQGRTPRGLPRAHAADRSAVHDAAQAGRPGGELQREHGPDPRALGADLGACGVGSFAPARLPTRP